MSAHGPEPETRAEPASPPPAASSPNGETVKFLCDLSTKRHDLAERSYDALNARLAALFAFNGFLVPASIGSIRAAVTATKDVPVPPIGGNARLIVLALWCLSLATVGIACAWGYIARRVKSLPDPLKLYRDFGTDGVADAGAQVLANLDGAWIAFRGAVTFKARCLNVALLGIAAEVILLVVTVVVSL